MTIILISMRDLNTLNSEEITRLEVLQEIDRQVGEIIYFCEDKEAFALSREFRAVLQRRELNAKPEILGQLKKWATLVNYVSLPAQRDSEIIQLFQGEIKEVLPLDEEIVLGRLEALLWVNPAGPREELCKKLVQALRDNRQKIGALMIGEWLALFIHSYPGRPQLLELEERDFLNKNPEPQKLAEGNKTILAKLLKIYDALQPLGVMAEAEKAREQGVSAEEKLQVRLGQALAKTASAEVRRPPQGYQGPQDLRDIRPANGGARFPQAQNRASATKIPSPSFLPAQGPLRRPATPERQRGESVSEAGRGSAAPTPPPPSQGKDESSSPALNKNFVQSAAGEKGLASSSNSEIMISVLEAAAQKGDPVEEERLRQIIRQNFNQLSPEVRSYIINSPFWAE